MICSCSGIKKNKNKKHKPKKIKQKNPRIQKKVWTLIFSNESFIFIAENKSIAAQS